MEGKTMTDEAKTFTQEEVNDIVGKRLVREREKIATEQRVAAGKTQQDTLAAEAKWKELADLHQARIAELESFEVKAKAYQEIVKGMLKAKVKSLGETAKKAVEGLPESMDETAKLAWLNENAALFEVVGDGVGTPYRPKPTPKEKQAKGPITRFGPIKL